jgi:galactonate dehydratase
MKIAAFELFTVPPRWLFLKLTADSGLCGWGEPIVEGHTLATAAAVQEACAALIGWDARRIEDIWQYLWRGRFYRGGPILMSVMAGIDQALWDLKGRSLGVPVYDLLGGRVRDRVRVYSWIGGDTPVDAAAQARARAAAGFTAVKMNATAQTPYVDSFALIDAVVTRVGAVREATGPAFGIAIDFHGRLHRGMAKLLARELEPLHPLFLEEPVLPEHGDTLREIARHTAIPIATGERLYSRWDYKRMLADGFVDIIQPDPSHAGGISESRRIAAMAEAHDVAVALHCPLGPIALAACLQLDATTPNAFIQEQSLDLHYHQGGDLLEYLVDRAVFAYRDGYVALPTGPGLGIDIDEARVRDAAARGHSWRNPLWRTEDGAVAEW